MSLNQGWDPPRPGWSCPECGFDFDATPAGSASDAIRAFGRRYRTPLTRGLAHEDLDALIRMRPSEGCWSALEYACHVRDAFGLYSGRIARALTEDTPELAPMRRDELPVKLAYNTQSATVVADELAAAAGRLADQLAEVTDDQWDRSGIRDGEVLTVTWMARNAVHEGNHHLLDIGRVLRHVRGR